MQKQFYFRPIREGVSQGPHLTTQLFAKGFGRILVVLDSGFEDKADILFKVIDYGGQRFFDANMRWCILDYVGKSIVDFGFNVAWIFKAFSQVLCACRVIDLSAKEAFEKL